MTFTIDLGSWLFPVVVTVLAFGWYFWQDADSSYGSNPLGNAITGLFTLGAALIVTLVAWLIWALVR